MSKHDRIVVVAAMTFISTSSSSPSTRVPSNCSRIFHTTPLHHNIRKPGFVSASVNAFAISDPILCVAI